MGGIRDYTYQNIIFVHDFVFIFLILVFWMIIAYFIIIFFEYTVERQSQYLRLFIKEKNRPLLKLNDYIYSVQVNAKVSKRLRELRKMQANKEIMQNIWNASKKATTILSIYSSYIKKILNQVHNLKLEVIWTFIPIVIILELIFPSLSLIADEEISSKASLHTVNVIGNQWYWTYELNVVMGVLKQTSNLVLIDDTDATHKSYARLLATTNVISIPVGLKTAFFITSNDVAHSWAIPGLGLKVDAIPGRINLKTVIASKIGLYSGMCSELCGIEHGFMPISLQVLSLNNWGYNLEFLSEKTLSYNDIRNVWYI